MEEQCRRHASVAHGLAAIEGTKVTLSPSEVMILHFLGELSARQLSYPTQQSTCKVPEESHGWRLTIEHTREGKRESCETLAGFGCAEIRVVGEAFLA